MHIHICGQIYILIHWSCSTSVCVGAMKALSEIYKYLSGVAGSAHEHIMAANGSKLFAGIVVVLLNVGSKFVTFKLSASMEEYIKQSLGPQILVFAMAWVGTRDIYTSVMVTLAFIVISDFLFNEESSACIVPSNYRVLHGIADINKDGVVTASELAQAKATLKKHNAVMKERQGRSAIKERQGRSAVMVKW